jgi:lycopene beta-cyclase
MSDHVDYALVGGGLQNGLIALALRARRPRAHILMIERGDAPGGNHTWCFHAGDLASDAAEWIAPLVTTQWPGYEVAFADHRRTLDAPYACISSSRFAAHVVAALDAPGCRVHLGANAEEVAAHQVTVRHADGSREIVHARVVIDARGPDRAHVNAAACGWQKFLGQELVLAAPHGLTRPMLMDATVAQRDGFRFVYTLPLAPDRLLVEDTYFSDSSYLDVSALRVEVAAYAAARGWQVAAIAREETGVLPMPWQLAAPQPRAPLVAGYAGGWFHPVTGYSFPIAVRLAALVAAHPAEALFGPALEALAAAHARQLAFASRLTQMMFRWFPPDQRHHVLARFYSLPDAVIRRFYALELTGLDRARIVTGRPPRGMSWRAALGLEAR